MSYINSSSSSNNNKNENVTIVHGEENWRRDVH